MEPQCMLVRISQRSVLSFLACFRRDKSHLRDRWREAVNADIVACVFDDSCHAADFKLHLIRTSGLDSACTVTRARSADVGSGCR